MTDDRADPVTGVLRSRWTDERSILRELETLNDMSMDQAGAYYRAAREAAEAEAAHKTARAQAMLRARAAGARSAEMAMAEAEADPDVARLYVTRLTTTAVAEAIRESLRSIRTNQDGLRTAVASHRDMFAGPGFQK